jgi:hypothetical protein
MRMSRVWAVLAASLFLVGNVSGASPLEKEMREVERLRGLTFLHDVTQRTIDRKELQPLIREQLAKSIPYSIEDYIKILEALQLVDGSAPDVIGKMFHLYDSQVLAFYDPMTHTYFAIRQLPESLAGMGDAGALRESVVMHELTHALQDQRFGAAKRDRALQHDTDGELAYHALLEGEATLVMLEYLLEKSGQSFDEAVKSDFLINALGGAAAADKTVDPGTPRYFIEALKFPYLEGLKLVADAYRRGGWKAIDGMHANPPRTTRELLHPAEYWARVARGEKGSAPFNPRSSSDLLTTERLGEFHWRYLVGDHAEGWVDDRVTVKRDGGVVAETRWESAEKAASFRDAYVAFLRGRNIEPQVSTSSTSVTVTYKQ